MALSYSETSDLRVAKALLENPGIAAKFSNFVGTPIEKGFKKLPESWSATVNDVAKKSIETALDIALLTMDRDKRVPSSNWWHKLAVVATGAGGGAFGLPALAIELPVSTTIILRSIADIARSEGEDLNCPDAKLQCVQVLALGGKSKGDDGTESGYFVTRAALAKAVSEAASHLTTKGLSQRGAPAIVRLISQVASRFSIVVSEKAAAQAVPVVGAFGGAANQCVIHRSFSGYGKRSFYCPKAGAASWPGRGTSAL